MRKKFKKSMAMIMLATMIFTGGVQQVVKVNGAEQETKNQIVMSGNCGENATWTLNSETGEVVVSGTGEVSDFKNKDVMEKTKILKINEGITSIKAGTFYGCNMETVSLPESLKEIQGMAFYDCEKLKEVVIPKNVNILGEDAFGDCIQLKKCTILGDVKTEGGVFGGCLPDTLELAGKCENLGRVLAAEENSIKELKLINGNKNYKIKNGFILSSNERTLLGHVGKVKNVKVPKTVTKIGDYAFFMTYAQKVTLNSKLKEIGEYAFYFNRFKKLEITKNVTKIGDNAFARNEIKTLTLNKKIKSIGENAFDESELKKVKFYNNPTIKQGAFDKNVIIEYAGKAENRGSFAFANYIINEKTGFKFVCLDVNKIKGTTGYQVKLTQPKKNKKMTINTTKTKVLRKTKFAIKYTPDQGMGPKIKKDDMVYAKVRPYTVKNGKKVYGKWSVKTKLDGYPDFGDYKKSKIK